jgi:trimeric autotransporter adhesin
MAIFTGTAFGDLIHAGTGTISGFTTPDPDPLGALQDANGDEFFGGTGADTITAGSGKDSLTGGMGADSLDGSNGDDTYYVGPDDLVAGDYIGDSGFGVGDIDRLHLTGKIDFTVAGITGIEELQFGINGGYQSATFLTSTSVGGLANNLRVVGSADGFDDDLVFNMALNVAIDLRNYTFQTWGSGDRVVIIGDGSGETYYGSVTRDYIDAGGGNDTIHVGLGVDTVLAGAGDDLFHVTSNTTLAAGTSLDGGAQSTFDELRTGPGTDFRNATVTGFEMLTFAAGGYVQVRHDQIAGFASVNASVSSDVLAISMTGDGAVLDLSGLQFVGPSWSINDRIEIIGSAGQQVMRGSGYGEYMVGGAGVDVLTGRGGADELYGGADGDSFAYYIAGEADGDTIDGGSEIGAVDTLEVADAINFTTAVISSIEQVRFFGFTNGTTRIASFNAAHVNDVALARALNVIGSGDQDYIHFVVGNATPFDASQFTFQSWTAGTDYVFIDGRFTSSAGVTMKGSSSSDRIDGGDENDTITGGSGRDTLSGGASGDTFRFTAGDVVVGETIYGHSFDFGQNFAFEQGNIIEVSGAVDFRVATIQSIDHISFAGATPSSVSEARFNGSQFGHNVGVEDNSTITGSGGIDRLVIHATGANSTANAFGFDFNTWNAATDRIELIGDANVNNLYGTFQADTIIGGGGRDVMLGGSGADVLRFTTGDVVAGEFISGFSDPGAFEAGNTIELDGTVDFRVAGNIVAFSTIRFTGAGTAQFNSGHFGGFGIASNAAVQGSSGLDQLQINAIFQERPNIDASAFTFSTWGSGGDVVYLTGTTDANQIIGSSVADILDGGADNDTLYGGAGIDVMQGNSGNDSMFGGADSDNYYVDSALDVVVEAAGAAEGTADQVFFTNVVGATLSTNVEYGFSLGTTASLTGNSGDNVLIGGYATVVQTLYGGDGNDFLAGTPVGDTLYGGAGVDDLRGFAGNDQLFGGDGNDSYYVEQVGDVVTEAAGVTAGATDIIYTNVNLTMAANVEYLFTYGAATNVTGNADANAMLGVYSTAAGTLNGGGGNDLFYGSNFADALNGGADNDTMFGDAGSGDGFADTLTGGTGNDTYFLKDAADVAVEAAGEGTDVIYAATNYTLLNDFETLFIYGAATSGTGNSAGNALIGSYITTGATLNGAGGNDTIIAGAGADTVIGGAAADTLTGAGGNDQFTFNLGEAAGDYIVDFAGNGAGAGDSLRFVGYGAGATFTQVDATNWQVNYNGGGSHDIITFGNSAAIHASDYVFV